MVAATTRALGLPGWPYGGVVLGVNASCNAPILAWRSADYRRAFRRLLFGAQSDKHTAVVHVVAPAASPPAPGVVGQPSQAPMK